MPLRTLELLESLMSGHEMSPDELDGLVTDRVTEDLFLEYKHGDELEDRKKAARTLRQYLGGFANSSGGVLVVGVDDTKWEVAGCSAPGGGDLREWAASCLTPIAHQFSPLPRFQVVKHPAGQVLVAAVQRCLNLVYCVEDTRPTYYLRLHDETLSAPDYLISDLVLGRRQDPYLRIGDLTLTVLDRPRDTRFGFYDLVFSLAGTCQNLGLSWATQPRLGHVAWTIGERAAVRALPASEHLLSYLEVRDVPAPELQARAYLRRSVKDIAEEMGPFSVEPIKIASVRLPVSHHQWYTPYTWLAALYLLCRSSAPAWYQLSLAVDKTLLKFIEGHPGEELAEGDFLQLRRVVGERPVVAWDGLKTEQGRG